MVWVSGGSGSTLAAVALRTLRLFLHSWCRSALEGLGFLSRGVYGGAMVWVTGG